MYITGRKIPLVALTTKLKSTTGSAAGSDGEFQRAVGGEELKQRSTRHENKMSSISPSRAAGRAIRDLNLPLESTVVAILRKGQLIMPHGDTVLQPADEVLAVVHRSCLSQLAGILGKRGQEAQ